MSSRYGKSSPTMALLLDGNGHLSWERTGALIVLAIFVVYSLGSRALYLLNAGRKLFMVCIQASKVLLAMSARDPRVGCGARQARKGESTAKDPCPSECCDSSPLPLISTVPLHPAQDGHARRQTHARSRSPSRHPFPAFPIPVRIPTFSSLLAQRAILGIDTDIPTRALLVSSLRSSART